MLVLIAGLTWVFWPQQAVLFSELKPEDATQITAQLDKQKIPYTLSRDGSTIMTDPDLVPKARLEVFSGQLDLKSGVGLELFSGNDLGMTEFSQHVNYVRALQGELTRTLLTIEGVESARVHVAMPEGSGRRTQTTPTKVAITLNSKEPVPPATVNGVQRLVMAAVPGVKTGDVVIVDGKGNLLTRARSAEGGDASPGLGAQLEQKAAIESYLEKKAAKLLQSIAPPPARAEVIVDVTLSDRQRHVTREELIPSGSLRGMPVGLLQKAHFGKQPAVVAAEGEEEETVAESKTDDSYEFANGKQIERIENPIGAVERISLSVVVSGVMPVNAEEVLQRSLSRGLGLNPKRGDDIAVLILPPLAAAAADPAASADVASELTLAPAGAVAPVPQAPKDWTVLAVVAGVAVLGIVLLLFVTTRRRPDTEVLATELRQMLKDADTP